MAIQKQKKKTWEWCSRYIRLKHADSDGICECYTCGKKYHWKQIQAGHGLSGRTNNILFNEDIIRPQCSFCNVKMMGKLDEFGAKLRVELGDAYDEYLKTKRDVKKYTEEELKELEEMFKTKAKEFAKAKNQIIK